MPAYLIADDLLNRVGLLTFLNRKNTKAESFKARKVLIFLQFLFYRQLNFHAQGRVTAIWYLSHKLFYIHVYASTFIT